jgi:hypothetical protein
MYGNWKVTWPLLSRTNVLAAFFGKIMNNTVTAPFWKWASMECQRFLVLYVRKLKRDLATAVHNQRTGSLLWQNNKQHGHCPILKLSVNGASTIFACVSCVIYVAIGLETCISEILTAFKCKNNRSMLPAPSWKWASIQCEWLLVLHLG